MFEREIHTEVHRLLQQLNPSTPFLALRSALELLEAEVPYSCYLRAEALWRLHEERLLRQRHPYFDYTAPAIHALLQRLDELLLQHARFPVQELRSLVEAAVKVRLNFLCRPRITLKWFVFRGEPLQPVADVLLRLEYFSDYPYLLDGLRRQLQSMATAPTHLLSVWEFERLVQQVDSVVLDFTPSQFLQLLQPLEAFFTATNPEARPGYLPTAALIVFLDDKGIRFLAHELEHVLRQQRLRWISHEHFLAIVDRLLAELTIGTAADTHTLPLEFPPESEPTPPAEEQPATELSSETPPSAPEDTSEKECCPSSPATLYSASPPAASPVSPSAEADLYSVLSCPPPTGELIWNPSGLLPEVLQATWQRKFPSEPELLSALPTPAGESPSASSSPPVAPAAPPSLIRLLRTPAWYHRYARTLFRSEEALMHVIGQLEQCTHWKEAAAVIDRSFAAYGIDPTSRTSEQFRQDILQHYASSGSAHAFHRHSNHPSESR